VGEGAGHLRDNVPVTCLQQSVLRYFSDAMASLNYRNVGGMGPR
jgi:hypothetical protein